MIVSNGVIQCIINESYAYHRTEEGLFGNLDKHYASTDSVMSLLTNVAILE